MNLKGVNHDSSFPIAHLRAPSRTFAPLGLLGLALTSALPCQAGTWNRRTTPAAPGPNTLSISSTSTTSSLADDDDPKSVVGGIFNQIYDWNPAYVGDFATGTYSSTLTAQVKFPIMKAEVSPNSLPLRGSGYAEGKMTVAIGSGTSATVPDRTDWQTAWQKINVGDPNTTAWPVVISRTATINGRYNPPAIFHVSGQFSGYAATYVHQIVVGATVNAETGACTIEAPYFSSP